MRDSALVATFANPWGSLLAAVLIGWVTTLYFGRRVARVSLGRLVLGTLFLTLTAVAGARVHYVLASSLAPSMSTRLADSGLHAGGGVIGLIVGLVLLRRVVGISVVVLADVAAIATGPALATYRLGCQARGCCFGIPSDLPWAVRHGKQSVAFLLHANDRLVAPDALWSAAVHPLPLYFAAAALAITAIGWLSYPHRRYDGQIALLSLVLFSLSTLALEPLRAAVPGQVRWGPLPQLVWIAGGLSVAGLTLSATFEAAARRRAAHGHPAPHH